MPLAIWILGLGIFAQGTSELMLAGLLPEMAADLGVTIPQSGWLISAFALGMLVGSPVMAVLTLRWPRRLALLVFRETPAMPYLLIVHLGVVLALFLTLPYGKFVHGLYRTAALVKHASES